MIEAVTASVPVIAWTPTVFITAEKSFVPLTRVEFAGRTAATSLLEKLTVPAYAVAVLLKASSAITVKLNDDPGSRSPGRSR